MMKNLPPCLQANVQIVVVHIRPSASVNYFWVDMDNYNVALITDGPNSEELFAALDLSFLLAYAVAMFVSGFIAERMSLRYFLSLGMILSGFFCYLFGVAKTADIHSMWYFVFVQLMAGVFQTTGWPGVVTVMDRWYGSGKRGLIFGLWNSHTSIGNVLGTLLPSHYIITDWSRSFIVPGLIMGIMGFVVYLFLADSPEIVLCQERPPEATRRSSEYTRNDEENDSSGSEPNDANIIIGQQVKLKFTNSEYVFINNRVSLCWL